MEIVYIGCLLPFLVSLFKDEVVAGIEARIAAWTFLPEGKMLSMLTVIGLHILLMATSSHDPP